MNEKPEAEEFDDEEADEILEAGDDVDVDRVIRDLDQARAAASRSRATPRGAGWSGCARTSAPPS